MKIIVFILFVTLGIRVDCFAQVNLQTGASQISIPLYSYTDPNNRIGTTVSLNYTAGNGLKVNEIASSVGTGWSLQCGGTINRVQRGEPDDQKQTQSYSNYYGSLDYRNNYYPNGYLYSEYNPITPVKNGGSFNPLSQVTYDYKPPKEFIADREQDVFAFSFNGRSGEFIIGRDGTVKKTIDSKLKIDKVFVDMTANNIRTTISEFHITDETGIKYIFKDLVLSEVIKYDKNLPESNTTGFTYYPSGDPCSNWFNCKKISVGRPLNQFVVSKWYLTEIINPLSGASIFFSYEPYTIDISGNKFFYKSTQANQQAKYSLLWQKIKGVDKRIKSISCSDKEKINFLYYDNYRLDLPQDKSLKSINISYDNKLKSEWILTYGYFAHKAIQPFDYQPSEYSFDKPYLRLCLLTLQRVGYGELKQTPYKFEYYLGNPTNQDQGVPAPFSNYQDHWGYSNAVPNLWGGPMGEPGGDINNILNHTYYSLPLNNPTYYRQVQNNLAQNGIVKSVQYPTGGSLAYEYEQNNSLDNLGSPVAVGGVRVNKTFLFDGNDHSKDIITNYSYIQENGLTSGWGYEPLIYSLSTNIRIHKCGDHNKPAVNFHDAVSYMPMAYNLGIAIGGEGVKLALADKGGQLLGTIGSFVGGIVLNIIANALWDLFADPYKDYTISTHSPYPINAGNLLPLKYSRVETKITSQQSNNGKVVYEFTSNQDYSPFVQNFTFPFADKQRYGSWLYGLPKAISVYDNNNNLKRKTVNNYNFIVNHSSDQNFVSQKWTPHFKEFDCEDNLLNNPNSNYITHDIYYPFSGRTELIESKEYSYNQNNEYIVKTTSYQYSTDDYLPRKITSLNSKGQLTEQYTYFPLDYTNSVAIQKLKDNNIFSTPVSTQTFITINGNKSLISGSVNEYGLISNGDVKVVKTHSFESNQPVSENLVAFNGSQLIPNTQYYKPTAAIEYNDKGLPAELISNNQRVSKIYGYNNKYVVAEIMNALPQEVAYTSFEADESVAWSYSGVPIVENTALTGKKVYNLNSGSINRPSLNASAVYIVSYWSKNGAQNVSGSFTYVAGKSSNGWTCYEHKITGTPTASVYGGGIIDELRLFPEKARMTTYTFEPLIGMTSQNDVSNSITYYEYDAFNRLFLIRDEHKNILKKICYNNSGEIENCLSASPLAYWNQAISQVFTRNNCGTGYTGGQVAYTIPANTYSSSFSPADADAQAQADVNTNGQAYANANGACDPTCNYSNCSGEDKRCVNGYCETGYKIYSTPYYDNYSQQWVCSYHYEWSDGYWSVDYTWYSNNQCAEVIN